jgi:ATP-binding cassette subfamily B (MDR/TAP) protein 1
MGVSLATFVVPQVSVSIEAFAGARVACYPAIAAINRKVDEGKNDDDSGNQDKATDPVRELAVRRGSGILPRYTIDSSSESGKKLDSVSGEIEFHDVSFRYPARLESEVFNGFSLKIEPGKTVALVGFSGSVSPIPLHKSVV